MADLEARVAELERRNASAVDAIGRLTAANARLVTEIVNMQRALGIRFAGFGTTIDLSAAEFRSVA